MELTGPFITRSVIKKSRFIASACNASTPADAKAFIDLVRQPDASHNCWAYRIDSSIFRYSDDGEPSGTAGKSIFAAICASKVERVVVVVTRYFGGTKLGAGGLIRAYKSSASQCLQQAPKVFKEPTVVMDVKVGWSYIGAVQAVAERLERVESVYDDSGCTITVRIPEQEASAIQMEFTDACAGAVEIITKRLSAERE